MKIYVVMGVSGVGKSTIGKLLARELQLPFYDADDFHSVEDVRKMKSGIPLTDEDRKIWLGTLADKIKEWNKNKGAVLACSALKEAYREQLQSIPKDELTWIFLFSNYDVIMDRITARKNHYFRVELLRSQYKILEHPEYGIHINVNASEEEIISNIMKALNRTSKSEIGLMGLGVMGKSLALNMASKGIKVSVYNRQVEKLEVDIAKKFAMENEKHDFPWFDEPATFIASLEKPRTILLMVNAGKAVDLVIESLLPFLNENDLIIDGGNSFYKDTKRRENHLKEKGVLFMGLGISGGEEGARNGPSLMPGGHKKAYGRAGSILERIAAKDKIGNPCCAYIGPEGVGHFVKMVHNGIEYGEMQLIAEISHYMRFHLNSRPEDIATLFEKWNKVLKSYLLGISAEILRKKEGRGYLLDLILDVANQKGTGGWSTNAALELGVPLDTITAAVMARNISAMKKERIAALEAYDFVPTENDKTLNDVSEGLFKAYKAGTMINHAIGFDLLMAASKNHTWNLNLSEIARIWTNGCIIRSGFMEECIAYFKEVPSENLLLHPEIAKQLKTFQPSLMETIATALKKGFPLPVLSAAANYFLGFTSKQSSANMIQAQRDYFGAHTFERKDRPRGEFFHAQWQTP